MTVLIVVNGSKESLKAIINSLENNVPVILVKVNIFIEINSIYDYYLYLKTEKLSQRKAKELLVNPLILYYRNFDYLKLLNVLFLIILLYFYLRSVG